MLKTYPWEEPHGLYFENKGDHTRIWLAIAEK